MVSIILPLWNRTTLLANTLVSIFNQQDLPPLEVIVIEDRPQDKRGQNLCEKYPVRYIQKDGHSSHIYNNVGSVYNIGIKQATGDILIMQSAECKYETNNGIAQLVDSIVGDELASAVPLVQALEPDGSFLEWFCHPREGQRPGWTGMFCHAFHRAEILKIGGYDEIFNGYGFDDDLLLYRLKRNGVKPQHIESVLVSHQWHSRHTSLQQETDANRQIYLRKIAAVEAGEPNIAWSQHRA